MMISVVVPKLQRAQWERIEEEFKDVEYEMIPVSNPAKALSLATGRFIVFLEEDSAFEPGSLRKSLEVFQDNPSYRKLAMVTTAVDYDKMQGRYGFSYDDNVELTTVEGGSTEPYPVSIGYFYGSVMRTTAYRQLVVNFRRDALYRSTQISDQLWSRGLRIEMNPLATYYAPLESEPTAESAYKIKNNAESLKVWNREFIL
jgi:hypothetical protein